MLRKSRNIASDKGFARSCNIGIVSGLFTVLDPGISLISRLPELSKSEVEAKLMRIQEARNRVGGWMGVVVFLAMLSTPLGAQQPARKPAARTAVEVCAYGSRLYREHSYQVHGLTCQECIKGGDWVDVGGQ